MDAHLNRGWVQRLPRGELILIAACWALAVTGIDSLAGPATLILLVVLPGRLILLGCGRRRARDPLGDALLSLAVSLAVIPILLNPIWRFTNNGAGLVAAVAAALLAGHTLAACFIRTNRVVRARQPLFPYPAQRIVFTLIVALIAFATILSYWPAGASAGPLPAQIHDFVKHHAVLYSLERAPLPLGNPFFAQAADGPVYYYHFFYLIPATVRAAAPGWSIQWAFGLQTCLVAIATTGMFALLAGRLGRSSGAALMAALLATAIGGLDIIPLVLLRLPAITLDAWADTLVRVHNLLTQMIWTPQNVQGVMITLLGAYLLSLRGRPWVGWTVLGPLLIAALIGSSVWISAAVLPAAALLVALDLRSAIRQGVAWRPLAAGVAAIVILSGALAAPSLLGFAEMSARLGKSLTFAWPHQSHALLGQFLPPGVLANLIDLPWILLIEFGPLLVLPLLLPRTMWRRAWDDRGGRLMILAACVALIGFVTARSHFRYNDFGQKIVMVAQAAGVLLGACLFAAAAGGPHHHRGAISWFVAARRGRGVGRAVQPWFVALLLLLGLPVAVFQTPIATMRRFFQAEGITARFAVPAALRSREEAALLTFLRDELPDGAVIQPHWDSERLDMLQMVNRQIGVTLVERDTMVFQTRDSATRAAAVAALAGVLETGGSSQSVYETLSKSGVTHVVVGTVERRLWTNASALRDQRFFHAVFNSDGNAVYELVAPD
jgi:hypothetical protein